MVQIRTKEARIKHQRRRLCTTSGAEHSKRQLLADRLVITKEAFDTSQPSGLRGLRIKKFFNITKDKVSGHAQVVLGREGSHNYPEKAQAQPLHLCKRKLNLL